MSSPRLPLLSRLAHFVRQKLVAGFLALFPVTATLWVAWQLLRFLDGIIGKYTARYVPGLGLLSLLLLLVLTGSLVTSYLGRRLFALYDALLSRVPLARTIYLGAKQLVEALGPVGRKSFQRVVLIQFPRRGLYMVGFVTKEGSGEVQERTPEFVASVFVPTTPNPTSGFLVLVPEADIIPLQMSVEDGVKLVVSGGLISPERLGAVVGNASAAQPPPSRPTGELS